MFKRLRERIAEEATKFPVGQHSNNSGKPLQETENKLSENTSEDLITLSDSSSVLVPHTSRQQFSIGEDEDGSPSDQSTPQKEPDASGNAQEQHSSIFSNFGLEYRPSKKPHYVPQSDIESEREEPPTLNLDGISKDQLLLAIQALKARSYKYKNKYSEVVKNYKELRDEKIKIENALIETQDKGLRRITELREQCNLEQKAKAHLEENLRLLLEEKDSRISVLETQINLLKAGGKSGSSKTLSEDGDIENCAGDSKSDDSSLSASSDQATLQEKVERLQHQHNQNKKTIKAQTEQISLLRKQNESLSQELEEKVKLLNGMEDELKILKNDHQHAVKALEEQLQELEKQQEESAMSMAETKKNMHLELEFKDKQLLKAEEEAKFYQMQAEQGKDQILSLKKEHDERVNELTSQLKTEKVLEEEKQSLLQELAQGKAAAVKLMQQECSKKIAAVEEEWKTKYDLFQAESQKAKETELKELQDKLEKADLKIKELQSLTVELEKDKVALQNSVEKLESEIGEKHAKLEASLCDYEKLKLKEASFEEQEKCNSALKLEIEKFMAKEQELNSFCESCKKKLQDQINIASNLENEKNSFADQVKQLQMSQSELENTCSVLERKLSSVSVELKGKADEVQKLSLEINRMNDEMRNLHHLLESVQINEKFLPKQLNSAVSERKEFQAENSKIHTKIRFLIDKTNNIEKLLVCKEQELKSISDEIILLEDALNTKELAEKQSQFDYNCIESKLTSVEQQQLSVSQALVNFKTLFSHLCNDTDFVFKKFQQIENYFLTLEKDNKTIKIQEASCLKDKVESRQNYDNLVTESDRKESDEPNMTHDELANVKQENISLKNELDSCKAILDSQNIEFAKNITMLHQSLSELQEERNDLSLVLQNIEKDMSEQHEKDNKVLTDSNLQKFPLEAANGHNWELKISELNSKVKSEIDALSLQTEIVNKELRNLRQQFKSNQDSFSEKLSELETRLLHRTELLINTKEDLDASENCVNTLKDQLESTELELQAKTKMVHSFEDKLLQLENKNKEMKERFLQKELDLKSVHNSQLLELKNQTQLTIDRLTGQMKKSEEALRKKEEELSAKLAIRDSALVSEDQTKSISMHQTLVSHCRELADSFDKLFSNPSPILESYSSKISSLILKTNKLALKLKENDERTENQQKLFADLQTDCSRLQNDLRSATEALNIAQLALAAEKEKALASEGKISKMKEEYKKSLQSVSVCSEQNVQEVRHLQILLASSSEELEDTKIKHLDACSTISKFEGELLELQQKYETLNDMHEKSSQELSHAVSQILSLNENFNKNMEVINKLLHDKEVKLDDLRSKFSVILCKYKSKDELLKQLKSELEISKSRAETTEKRLIETEAKLLEAENLSVEMTDKHENLLLKIGEIFKSFHRQSNDLMSNYDNHLDKVTVILSDIGAKLSNIESRFSKIFSKSVSKSKEFSELKSQLTSFQSETRNLKSLIEQQKDKFEVSKDSAAEWKSKYDIALLQVKNLTLQHQASSDELKQLLAEKEAHLQDARNKLASLEEALQKIENESKIQDQQHQTILNQQIEKFTTEEHEKLAWKQKFDCAIKDLKKATEENHKHIETIEQLHGVIDAKSGQLENVVTVERFQEMEAKHLHEAREFEKQIESLKFEIETLSYNLTEKESFLQKKDSEINKMEEHHEESLRCLKEKLQNAEKNHQTQMEQLKLKLSQLEKENSILLSEKENLLVVQSQFKELTNKEEKALADVQSKEAELKKLQEKLDSSAKEQTEKICSLQESMKDKENTILKLKANLDSVNKEHAGVVDELNRKIKHLEVEREQLMMQAQERVSATEAKCRQDIRALQEKCDKLATENEEIEKLKKQIQKLNSQLDESLLVAESNQASALSETNSLKEKLLDLQEKLTSMEQSKSSLESELSSKVVKLEKENKELKGNCDDIIKLKAEKDELNEKLKAAVLAKTHDNERVSVLEKEQDRLKAENEQLSEELKCMKNESNSLRILEENEAVMKKRIEELDAENKKIKSEILELKALFEKEKESLLSTNKNLETKIQHLESSDLPVKDYVALLRKEYDEALKAKDDEVLGKLKQLVRDFSLQMDMKDKDSEQMITELMEKNQYLEEKLSREHALEISALRQDLFEKDCALEEIRDLYEERLKEKDTIVKKQEQTILSLRGNEDSAVGFSQPSTDAAEPSDWDDAWVVPDEVVENASPVPQHNACEEHVEKIQSLQEELDKSNAEIKELKVLLRLSPPETMIENNNRRDSLQSIPEPTEFEYLKNIIYEYMMGVHDPVTLAKVIAAVLRFNAVQTQQVIKREETRHSANTHWLS